MKQIVMILAAMLLTCCSSDNEVNAENYQAPANMDKTLIVYYSYSGDCKAIVNSLASQISADQVEILPTEKGQKYDANNYALGTVLMSAIRNNPNDAASYPSFDPVTVSLDNYQNVIIVTPLWGGHMAAFMQSYLFQNCAKLSGKTVAMIVSSHSTGISGVVADAQRLLPNASWAGDALHISNSNRNQTTSLIENWLATQNFQTTSNMNQKLYITIDGRTETATLVDNAATQALVTALQDVPITATLNDNDFEIWGSLGRSLPTSNEQVHAGPGDIVLYSGQYICIFCGSNSYSYTRLGKIDGLSASELRTFLKAGQNNISVTLSLNQTSGISQVRADENSVKAYTLHGTLAHVGHKGIVIQNGKKVVR